MLLNSPHCSFKAWLAVSVLFTPYPRLNEALPSPDLPAASEHGAALRLALEAAGAWPTTGAPPGQGPATQDTTSPHLQQSARRSQPRGGGALPDVSVSVSVSVSVCVRVFLRPDVPVYSCGPASGPAPLSSRAPGPALRPKPRRPQDLLESPGKRRGDEG